MSRTWRDVSNVGRAVNTTLSAGRHAGWKPAVHLALALALAGCTFDDGRGWATLRAETSGALALEAGHTELHTDLDHEVEVTAFQARLVALQLLTAGSAGGEGGGAFDPADPPPGYTLCHGGHCHGPDGALVSYEEMEAIVAGGGDDAAPVVAATIPVDDALDLLDGAPLAADPVEVGSVALSGVALVLRAVTFEGTVTLDGAAVPVTVALAEGADLRLTGPTTRAIGRGGAADVHLHLAVTVPADWLDGVHFDDLERGADGGIRISHDDNHPTAELLVGRFAAIAPAITVEGAIEGAGAVEEEHEDEHEDGHEHE